MWKAFVNCTGFYREQVIMTIHLGYLDTLSRRQCRKMGWWNSNTMDRIWFKCVVLVIFFHISDLSLISKLLLKDKEKRTFPKN